MKTLFDKNNRFSPDCENLDYQIEIALRPIFDQFVNMGYSPREISHVVNLTAMNLEMEEILTQRRDLE
jgi:hypothetical protein